MVDISSMLADTENRLFRRSSTAAIISELVKWAYLRCHVYESNETSFFSRRRLGRFGASGRKSARTRAGGEKARSTDGEDGRVTKRARRAVLTFDSRRYVHRHLDVRGRSVVQTNDGQVLTLV